MIKNQFKKKLKKNLVNSMLTQIRFLKRLPLLVLIFVIFVFFNVVFS